MKLITKSASLIVENRQKGRFAGFSLYLSNTVNIEDGHLCYRDGLRLPPLDFKTTCTGHGSYVVFYNERLDGTLYPQKYEMLIITELCEVIVKGCKRGTYGTLCNKHCSEHCEDNKCDIINGTCMGCMPGWTGQFCQTPCDSGSYGNNCQLRCSGHCMNGQTCNKVTGICDKGCASGWTGPKCNELCFSGLFGERCRYRCSGHCANDEHCNHVDGHCPNGCQNGYLGSICNKLPTVLMILVIDSMVVVRKDVKEHIMETYVNRVAVKQGCMEKHVGRTVLGTVRETDVTSSQALALNVHLDGEGHFVKNVL
ncbi:tyrosine-protein kinase receptor Tie-1-like [Saccostrea cucullata]|uniref:tyrosine-protein kinase receptor Tie-1-like n=1 Tax=Saccostrea cuccullata TaxID=36930 RepID=UPI002ED38342